MRDPINNWMDRNGCWGAAQASLAKEAKEEKKEAKEEAKEEKKEIKEEDPWGHWS